MNMVGVTANFDHMTVVFIADTTQVAVQFGFNWLMNQRLTVFGAKYDVHIVFN